MMRRFLVWPLRTYVSWPRVMRVRDFGVALCLSAFFLQTPLRGTYLTGLVVDDQSGRPVDKVRIAVWDKLKTRVLSETSTDALGRFAVDQLAPGQSYLVAMSRQNYMETVALL